MKYSLYALLVSIFVMSSVDMVAEMKSLDPASRKVAGLVPYYVKNGETYVLLGKYKFYPKKDELNLPEMYSAAIEIDVLPNESAKDELEIELPMDVSDKDITFSVSVNYEIENKNRTFELYTIKITEQEAQAFIGLPTSDVERTGMVVVKLSDFEGASLPARTRYVDVKNQQGTTMYRFVKGFSQAFYETFKQTVSLGTSLTKLSSKLSALSAKV